MANKKIKQSQLDKQHTSAAQKAWQERLKKETGLDASTEGLDFTWDKMAFIAGELWNEVIHYGEKEQLRVKNIVAIMGKDTRKTTVFMIFMWFLINEYKWLNGFVLRDTIDKSQTQMKMQLRKAVNLINSEYDLVGFQDITQESNDGFYYVRDPKRKDNQKIELLSFDSIVELGGFTTSNGQPAVFVYDELQNPNSKNKQVQSKETFLANYKFIDTKNRGIEISTQNILPEWIPRHYFLSNRYVAEHPLNLFAEAHFPYYAHLDEDENMVTGVREWMLEDPMNNHFVVHYVSKENVKPGWEDFAETLIVYGSKLSNFILRKNQEWEEEQMKLIQRGKPEDLAVIIGDLFEGYDYGDKAYHYSRVETILRQDFEKDYARYVDNVTIAIDLDFSRQIRIRPKYNVSKSKNGVKIYRTIREKAYQVKCNGVSDNGWATESYLKQTHNKVIEICTYIQKTMPRVRKVKLLLDDKKGQWVGRFNFGDMSNSFWQAMKVNFDQSWKIYKRPSDISMMQDSGFVIDIDDPTNTFLHAYYKNVMIKENSNPRKRIEKDRDEMVDDMNSDEYGLYLEMPKFSFNNRATKLLGGRNEW